MQLSHIPIYCLLLVFNLQVFRSHPINTALTNNDVDVLKTLLRRLEESIPAQNEFEQMPAERMDAVDLEMPVKEREDGQLRTRLDEAAIREFLSPKNLKAVRNDSSRRSSSCFGGRMDRIGAMSSLGCNTVGRYNPRT